jgi:hypothetical protein
VYFSWAYPDNELAAGLEGMTLANIRGLKLVYGPDNALGDHGTIWNNLGTDVREESVGPLWVTAHRNQEQWQACAVKTWAGPEYGSQELMSAGNKVKAP